MRGSDNNQIKPFCTCWSTILTGLYLFGAVYFQSSLASAKKKSVSVKTEDLHTVTVSRIIVKPKGSFDFEIASDMYLLPLIEELRTRSYNVRGAENVLFGHDKSNEARMLIGGTIESVAFRFNRRIKRHYCGIQVLWELFDRKKEEVIYKVRVEHTEWGRATKLSKAKAHKLILDSFLGLLEQPKFNRHLMKSTGGTAAAEFRVASFRSCSSPAKKAKGKKLQHGVYLVQLDGVVGSGFAISPDGLIVTANHVVEDADKVIVTTRAGRKLKARVVRRHPDFDVALLSTGTALAECLPVGTKQAEVGDELYAIGAPGGEKLAFSVTRGIVSGLRTFEDHSFIQTDAAINPGHSGGPMIGKDGHVMGVVSWKIAMPGFEGLGFGVPVDVLLDKLGLKPGSTTDFKTLAGQANKTSQD